MTEISVVRNPDALSQTKWTFYFMERNGVLYLDTYTEYAKSSPRHKYKVVKNYRRIDSRDTNLTVDQAPLPPDVVEEARQKFLEQITVEKWNNPYA